MLIVQDESAVAPSAAWEPPVLTRSSLPAGYRGIRVHSPLATAAFSRRDARLPGYPAAVETALTLGFTPALRTVGGHLAPLHEGTLVIDVIAADEAPSGHTRDRFQRAATAVRDGLERLGVPARIGELPGEYCPGEHSVNAAGVAKLAGIAQRVTPWGFLISINLVVTDPEPLRSLVAGCYHRLGLPVDPSRVGAVADYAPGVAASEVARELIPQLASALFPTAEPGRRAES
ncbi:MAG: lipoate--protein ligase family protein [Propionicimonas sp.]